MDASESWSNSMQGSSSVEVEISREEKRSRLDDASSHDDDDDDDTRSTQQDLKRMLHNPIFSDMLFLCGDAQEEVPASRMLVAARSPVLESMLLRSDMAESKQTRIALPTIDAATMRICLEFFYMDTIQDCSWLSIESCMKVIAASKFFLVRKLGQLAIAYLDAAYLSGVEDLSKAYSYGVNLLQAHPDIRIHDVLQNLSSHIVDYEEVWGSWLISLVHQHLSEEALVHLLHNLRPVGHHHCPMEYARFHYLIRWCASRLVLQVDDSNRGCELELVENAIMDFLPFSWQNDIFHIMPPVVSATCMDADMKRIMQALAEQLASVVMRVPLDLSKIPSCILCEVIEPLNILPPSMLMTAYRLQALSKAELSWDEFGCGDNYVIKRDDFTLISCKSDTFQGFARCSWFADFHCGTSFHWEIVMVTPCEQLRVGFCQGRKIQTSYNECLLGDFEHSMALSSDGFLHSTFSREKTEPKPLCDAFHGREGVRIGLHIQMETSCLFLIDGKGVETTFFNNNNHRMYPAISMQKPGVARIRMIVKD